MDKERFSYFLPPVWNTDPDGVLTLEEVWEYLSGRKTLDVSRKKDGVLSGIGTLQDVTRRVRSLPPEVYGNRQTGKVIYLPLVTFGGIFSKREGEGLQETSGLICLDIDHISSLGLPLEDLKDRLSKDREIGVRLVFTSPSGDGLKIVCKTSGEITDKESYRREFQILNGFVSRKYSIPIASQGLDGGISNIDRGCLLCYDPEAILQTWEETFDPQTHPLPPEESPRPRRELRDSVSPWDWDSFKEERLIPALFDRIDSVFPEMSFKWRGSSWESPYKLDGSPAKDPRRDKSVVTSKVPGVILEQGGEALPIIDYFMSRNNLQYPEAMRELSRLCGLEEDYKELCRKYAQMERNTTGGQTLQAENTTTSQNTPEEKFREYLEIPDLQRIASTRTEGIKTRYTFKDSGGKEENLTLPSGALTLICGKSSHGKSRLLQNLSLQIAQEEYNQGGEGVVLYFSFEESLLEVLLRYANLQVNIPQLSAYGTSNTEVLRDYFETRKLSKSPEKTRTEALPKLSGFETLYKSGRLRVYYTPDLLSGDLCSLLEYLSSQMKVKAVFLDYVQAIYKEENRKDRREELREICKEINKTAISLNVPIVLSAQLNRETPNPTEMSGDNIAESADITRYANTILLLWDSSKSRDIRGGVSTYLQTQEGQRLQEKGFTLGERGKLYGVISKNRGGTPDLEAILDYSPETGVILQNEDLPQYTTSGGILSL